MNTCNHMVAIDNMSRFKQAIVKQLWLGTAAGLQRIDVHWAHHFSVLLLSPTSVKPSMVSCPRSSADRSHSLRLHERVNISTVPRHTIR